LIVPGISLSLHKGLSFLGMATIDVGDDTDPSRWGRRGALSLIAGCAYSY
jgi:hypothetical protein